MLLLLSCVGVRANAFLGISTPMGLSNYMCILKVKLRPLDGYVLKLKNTAFYCTLKDYGKGNEQSMR